MHDGWSCGARSFPAWSEACEIPEQDWETGYSLGFGEQMTALIDRMQGD